jgi:hypothetical protein
MAVCSDSRFSGPFLTTRATSMCESGCNISTLGRSAFSSCSSLRSIWIPSSIHAISQHCFYDFPGLSYLGFGSDSQITTLGKSAFDHCCSVVSIRVRSSIEVIADWCFTNCRISRISDLNRVERYRVLAYRSSIGVRRFDRFLFRLAFLTFLVSHCGVQEPGASRMMQEIHFPSFRLFAG